jgi:hypothetical protein
LIATLLNLLLLHKNCSCAMLIIAAIQWFPHNSKRRCGQSSLGRLRLCRLPLPLSPAGGGPFESSLQRIIAAAIILISLLTLPLISPLTICTTLIVVMAPAPAPTLTGTALDFGAAAAILIIFVILLVTTAATASAAATAAARLGVLGR